MVLLKGLNKNDGASIPLVGRFLRTMIITYNSNPSIPVSIKLAHIGKISVK